MTEVMTFADALGRSDPGKRKLLLGNGFSIAWRATAFTYRLLRCRLTDSSAHLGRHRCVVERSFAWLARFRRLSIRHERRADLHLAFTMLACAVICLRQIRRFCP